jgi:hypothetical protein
VRADGQQEARLILPSADQSAGMNHQAALIVRYPQSVTVTSHTYRYLVLWADQTHVQVIAQTLCFNANSPPAGVATPAPPLTWKSLPPGLVYRTSDGPWLINSDEQPVQIHK